MTSIRRALAALSVSAVGAGVVIAPVSSADADPSDVYTNLATGTTSTYEVVPGRFSWEQARDAAAASTGPTGCAGHLAVITSAAETAFLQDNFANATKNTFIGGSKTNGAWAWVTGEPFSYTNWDIGEPNDYNGVEDKLQINYYRDDNNSWNDILDDWRSGYLVEYECAASLTRAVVTSVSPATGPVTGGDTVTITGTHFTGARSVTFGGVKAEDVNVVSDSEITATVPAYTGQASDKRSKRNVAVRVTTSKPSAKPPAVRYLYGG